MLRTVKNPNNFRKNIVECIKDKKLNATDSENLEKGVYNYAIQEASRRKVIKKWENPYFVQIYLDRLRSVYTNLSSEQILEQIKNKNIKAHELAVMTHQEMNPEKWKDLIDKKIKRDKKKYETRMTAATDTFRCRNCKSNECTYYQLQTRSADEPMTTFVTCINCGNKWRC